MPPAVFAHRKVPKVGFQGGRCYVTVLKRQARLSERCAEFE